MWLIKPIDLIYIYLTFIPLDKFRNTTETGTENLIQISKECLDNNHGYSFYK